MLKVNVDESEVDQKMLDRVLSQVKDDCELIREGPIFFLVLNRGKDNVFDD